EVRDVIEWLYFSGFPKSHNVSKAFDRRAGAEREVVGVGNTSCKYLERGEECRGHSDSERSQSNLTFHTHQTAPATELARKYDGWGTALKPAHEPIIVVRKPLVDADTGRKLTVADCVEKYGTGAINIDASRISMAEEDFEKYRKKRESFSGVEGVSYEGRTYNLPTVCESEKVSATKRKGGRFPANCITLDSDEFYSKYFNVARANVTPNVSPAELSKKASKKDRNSDWQ